MEEELGVKKLGHIEKGTGVHQSNIIYDKEGLAPCICAGMGVKQQPTIIIDDLYKSRDERVYEEYAPTLRSNCSGLKTIEINTISTKGKKIDIASTILAGYERSNMTGFNADNCVIEKKEIPTIKIRQATKQGYVECKVGGVADLSYPTSKTRRGRVQDMGNISPTLQAGENDLCKVTEYRIRKLTPKECWRLMGFSDEDFEKAAYIKNDVTEEFLCYAKSQGVIERLKQRDMETYALNIISDSAEQVEILTEMKRSLKEQENEKTQNVNVVIEMLGKMERKDCAISITKCLNCTETLCILMAELDQHRTAILEWGQEDKPNTEKYMRITLEENLHPMKLYTILTAIVQIIESKIYTSMLQKVNIQGCIANYEDCENSMVKMQISNLKMAATYTRVSSSQLYKQAGNSIVVDVLVEIFRNLFIETENIPLKGQMKLEDLM